VPRFLLTARPDSAIASVNDTMVVRWRPVAKDGFDLPARERVPRPARLIVSVGKTYDFEYTPERPSILRMEVRSGRGPNILLVRVPIRVEQ
jgi:hypothetical protein